MKNTDIYLIYKELLNLHGKQGWWPLSSLHLKSDSNPTKTGSLRGYHPGDYSHPQNDSDRFEICIGAILTQNTAWPNVEKALFNLKENGLLNPKKLMKASENTVKTHIRPAGYFNQKTKKLKLFTDFYLNLKNSTPTRDTLLDIWGVGPETADSILLYAYKVSTFVVDAYTKRIFSHLGFINEKDSYNTVKGIFEENLPNDFKIYQEYHALIVEHAKNFYNKRNKPTASPLSKFVRKSNNNRS